MSLARPVVALQRSFQQPSNNQISDSNKPAFPKLSLPIPGGKTIGLVATSAAVVSLGAFVFTKLQEQNNNSAASRSSFATDYEYDFSKPKAAIFPFPFKSSRRTLEQELDYIEAKRLREIKQQQQLWDDRFILRNKTVRDLRQLATDLGVKGTSKLRKQELISAVENAQGLRHQHQTP